MEAFLNAVREAVRDAWQADYEAHNLQEQLAAANERSRAAWERANKAKAALLEELTKDVPYRYDFVNDSYDVPKSVA